MDYLISKTKNGSYYKILSDTTVFDNIGDFNNIIYRVLISCFY